MKSNPRFAAVALLSLVGVLGVGEAAHAQTVIWSATLTAASGEDGSQGYDPGAGYGSLSSSTFTYKGKLFSVSSIYSSFGLTRMNFAGGGGHVERDLFGRSSNPRPVTLNIGDGSWMASGSGANFGGGLVLIFSEVVEAGKTYAVSITTTAPGAPQGLTATSASSTEVKLNWSPPSSVGGSTISGYKYRYKKSGAIAFGDWTAIANSASLTEHTVGGLEANTGYTFQMLAANSSGDGLYSGEATVTTDRGTPTVTLVLDRDRISEDGGRSTVTAILDQPSTAETTVTVSASAVSSAMSSHFTLSTNKVLTIAAEETSSTGTVTIEAVNNAIDDDDRQVTVSATATNTAGITQPSSRTLTIIDDESVSTKVTLSVSPTRVHEDAAGADQTVTVTAELDGDPFPRATDVTVSVSDGTAVAGTHYSAVDDFTVTIASGQTAGTGTFTLAPTDDNLDKPDVTVTVTGTTTSGLSLEPASGLKVTIEDDDDPPTVTLVLDPDSIDEDGGKSTVTATLDKPSIEDIEVTVSASPVPPAVASDFTLSDEPVLTIEAGDTTSSGTVTITASDNDLGGGGQHVTVSGEAASDGDLTPPGDVTLTITEDDPVATMVTLTVDRSTVAEDSAGSDRTVTVSAELDGARAEATPVAVSVTGGTAVAGTDYATVDDFTVTIAARMTSGSATFTLAPVDDETDEPSETVVLTGTTTVSGLTVAPADGVTVTITDNDPRPQATLVLTPTTIDEDGGVSTVTATLDRPSSAVTTITVDHARIAGTSASDYGVSDNKVLTIAARQKTSTGTVTFTGKDNDVYQPNARHVVVEGSASNRQGVRHPNNELLTIREDEIASTKLTLSASPVSVSEGGGEQTVTLTATVDEGARVSGTPVRVSVSGGAAVAGTDYSAVEDFAFRIRPGRTSGTGTFTLTPVDDEVDGPDKTVTVTATTPDSVGLPVEPVSGLTITIEDDDGAPSGTLALSVDTIATDNTVNIAEKTAGLAISGTTGSEGGVAVSVTIGSQSPLTATSDGNGAWSVNVPANAAYITGASVAVSVSASKTGFTAPSSVTRTLAVDLAAPSVSYTAPASLQVGAEVDVRPTTSDTDISSYSASGLPSGLSVNGTTGTIGGTPDTVDADTASVTVTVTDNAGNPVEVSIMFPMVAKGDQTLSGFEYSSNSVTFGDSAPTVTAPPAAVGTLSYTATPAEVCTVNETSGALTIVGVGACEVTVTAASTDEYNEATAKYTVTVNAAGTLTLNLDAIATDNTVNIAEKTAGFSISGDTGSEAGVSVSVAIGATTLTTTSADVSGTAEWSVTVPAEASHITGASVDVTVSASKTGFTPPTDVTRSLAIDLAAPSVTYTAPSSLQVGAEVDVRPTTSDTDISSYSASGLPSGLSVNGTTGAVSGTPDTVDANTASVTVTVTDTAGNPAEASIVFPAVEKGDQTLTGFAYSPDTVTFGDTAPTLTAPPDAVGTLSYTATPAEVCTVNGTSGALTIVGVGDCEVTVTAASTDEYNEATATYTVTVQDTLVLTVGAKVTLTVSPTNVAEDATGTDRTVTVTATLDGESRSEDTEVTVSVAAGTAVEGADFSAVTNVTVRIAGGATSGTATFDLVPLDDNIDEPDETVIVSGTTTASDLTVEPDDGVTLTIEDDETPPVISLILTPESISENGGASTVTAQLSHPSSEAVRVGAYMLYPHLYDGIVADWSSNRYLTFAPGKTASTGVVTITAIDNEVDNPNSVVPIKGSLSSEVLNRGITFPRTAYLTVVDNDEAPLGTLTLNLDTIATDDTVNIAEKTAGFSISGDTGSEAGVSVSVAIGATTLTTTSADVSGTAEWSVTVPAEASYITGTSVDVTVSASKTGFTPPTDVTRALTVDLAAPTVTYAAPSSLQVGASVDVRPTTSDTDISSYSASGLPSGLSINATTGAIGGTPDTVDANTAEATVTVTDNAGNPAEASIVFPMVEKGDQTLTGFAYSPDTVTFGDTAPTLTAPPDAVGTLSYTATPAEVCTVNGTSGALTIVGVGDCEVTVTAASTDEYNEATATYTVTVQDTLVLTVGAKVTLTVSPTNVAEDATGTDRTVTVTATLDGESRSEDTEVTVSVAAGTAVEGADFSAVTNVTVRIAGGATSGTATFDLVPLDDNIDEPDETVIVSGTTTASDLTVEPDDGVTLTIEDDETPPVISLILTPESISENGGASTVTAQLSHPSSEAVRVGAYMLYPHLYDGIVADWSSNRYLTFAPGKTASTGVVTITAIDNEVDNPNSVVPIKGSLSSEVLNRGITFPRTAYLTVVDNDEAPLGTLTLNLDTIATDDTVNIAEKTAGFSISGDTGSEAGVSVSVAIGATTLTTTSADVSGTAEWSVTVPAEASYITGTSVDVTVSASKTGFTPPTDVTRALTVDLAAPTVTYAAPSSLQVGASVDVRPTTSDTDISSYSASGLPSGLSINATTGAIGGTPDTVDANTAEATVTVTDNAGNPAEASIVFPMVEKGDQTLTGFAYSPDTVTFGDTAPTLTAPPDAVGTLSYTATPAEVCTVNGTSGALTIVGVGDCEVTVTAASTDEYNEATATYTVTVQDTLVLTVGAKVTLTVSPTNVAEDATGTDRTVTVTATLDGESRSEDTEVTVSVAAGTAVEGADFSAVTNVTVRIAGGATSGTATFDLVPLDDNIDEPDETVIVSGTTTASDLTVEPDDGVTLTIEDDETPPVISLILTPESISENGGASTVTAQLSHPSSEAVRVGAYMLYPHLYDGIVADWSSNRYLTFAPGKTASTGVVTITAIDNEVDNPNSVVPIKGSLSSEVLNRGITFPRTAYLTVVDNDEAPLGTLTLNLDAIATDDTVNIAEKTAGFSISGDTGAEAGVTVSVAIGATTLTTTSADVSGTAEWSVTVPADASYITGASVDVTVSASKTGFTPPTDVTRSLAIDLAAPSVTYTAPSSLQVGAEVDVRPTTSDTDISSYSASGLPSGLSINGTTGAISGTPDTVEADTASVTVTVADNAGNPAEVSIMFPMVAKGDQTLSGFEYSSNSMTFGDTAPTVTAPPSAVGTLSYTATPAEVCTVNETSGALTIVGVGACEVTVTAASTDEYNEATAKYTVTVNAAGTLTLNLDAIATDNTVNIAEKTAGFSISGDTGSEAGVTVSVAIGATTLTTTSADVSGTAEWSVTVPAEASHITGASVDVTVSASKAGFTAPTDVTRSLAIDLAAPSVTYAAPSSLQVGASVDVRPTTSDTDISSYSASGLPSGLSVNGTTGAISGAPDTVEADTASVTVTVADNAGNPAEVSIMFPMVAKGDQTLSGFEYSSNSVTFGDSAPTVTAPPAAVGTLSYTATPAEVCTVNGTSGALTIVGVGACEVTVTAASTDEYNEATAKYTVTVNAAGALTLNLDAIATDNTVNIAEKTAGFSISGDTGAEAGVTVSVAIGATTLTTTSADVSGTAEWSVTVPADASYITGASVDVTVSASKTGFTPPTDVTRSLAIDLAAPSVTYTAPSSLQVGAEVDVRPTTSDTDISSYSASGLPSGLSINGTTGAISGTPDTVEADTASVTVTVADNAGNPAEVSIMFPMVAKGDQTLSGFEYSSNSMTFGDTAPTVTAPPSAVGTLSYTATPAEVCTVNETSGALTIVGVGACEVTVTAASTDEYNEATAKYTVTVNAAGTLTLNLDTIATDNTVNIAEKTAGFSISGDTGSEAGVSVSVAIGATTLTTTSADVSGTAEWSVTVPAEASHITGASVDVTVSASKTGFTPPTDVTRSLAIDLAAPSVTYAAPSSLQVGAEVDVRPTTSDTDISSYSASGLPSGLSINGTTGAISGAPDTVEADTASVTVTVADNAGNPAEVSIMFPMVAKGDQTLSGFEYSSNSVTFGDSAPTVTAPPAAVGTLSYTATPAEVCTVNETSGALTIVGVGACEVTVTAASTDEYNEATAKYTVTVNAAGALSLNLDAIATDDTVNIAEKTAGFSISGDTGSEAGVSVSVAIGATTLTTTSADVSGTAEWSVTVPADASYITGTSVDVTVSASKTGFTPPTDVTRSLTVDLAAPTVTYAAPSSLQVGASVDVRPTTSDTDISSYSASGLPSGLSINATTGAISGAPDTVDANTASVTVTVTDAAGNPAEVSITFPMVNAAGALTLNLDTIATDDTVNIAEKTAGFSISGDTGAEAGVTVSVAIGATTLTTTSADVSGTAEWSVTVPADASYITGTSVDVTVSASKTGFTPPTDVTRSLTVDLAAPSVTYAAPSSLQVGASVDVRPTTSDTDISSYSASGLPSGLSVNGTTGAISGAPDTVDANTASVTVTVADNAGNPVEVSIMFPMVAKGDQTLSGFEYSSNSVTFGDSAPTVTAPPAAVGTLSYTATPAEVCTVNETSGALTIVGVGACEVTVTAASTDEYNEATAKYTVTVNAAGALTLNLDAIATDDTVNIAEKTAGFSISGDTGSEAGVTVSVAIGATTLTTTSADVSGTAEWSVTVPAEASHITGASVDVTVSASKAGFTAPTDVTRSLAIDLAAPSVTYAAPSSLQVGASVDVRPTTSDTDISSYSASGLPSGLSVNGTTGAISGAPDTVDANTASVTVTVTDAAGNPAEVSITFPMVNAAGALTLNLDAIATDNTVNIAEKTAGFSISGDTGSEAGVTVSVAIGATTLTTTSADVSGTAEWSVTVPADASYITGTSVDVTVSASKTGFTPPTDVTRSLTVDLAAPSVTYAAPSSLQVGASVDVRPTTSDTDISSYSASGLPSGLSVNGTTGAISGTPDTVDANTASVTVTVADNAGNPVEVSITFPMVEKGDQTLTGFAYSSNSMTFGDTAPTVTAPPSAVGTLSYTATPAEVCTVNETSGALTIVGVGACEVTVTAASTDEYNEATAKYTVTVNAAGALTLNLDTIATDDTVNIAEKTAGFSISGDTGAEAGVTVSVAIGATTLTTTSADVSGTAEWSVTVPADASYITGASVDVTVSASKAGFTAPTDVTRSLAIDLAAPSVTYTAPSSLQVGAEVDVRPTTSDTDISSYSASGLPSGLSVNGTTGAISGAPDTVDANTASVTVTVTDNAGNPAEVSITFPMVEKGDQTLTGFAYSSNSMTFGDTAPTVTAPPSAVGTLSYTATPAEVCTVNETSGALTIVGVGACEVTVTAASTDEYNEATAKYTVTVNAAGALTLNLDTIATDDTVNIAEKTAGFSISGDTGSEAGVSVSVAIGATTLTTTSADVSGTAEWSVTVPAEASHITGASVDVTVSASKAGFTAPTDVTRSLAIDLAAPSVTYAAPSSLKVGAEVDVRPTTSDTDISSYSASGLPSGLSVNGTTGAISGAPDTVDANTASVTVTVADNAGNPAEVSIMFPMVAKGDQTLSGFEYSSNSMTFGDTAPTVTAPPSAVGTLSYTATPAEVCTVNETSGALTIVGVGACEVTVTAASTDEYNEATAKYTVTVNAAGALTLNLDAIATDNTVNVAEKTAGFSISGDTGSEAGVSVSVAIGATTLTTTSADVSGTAEWSVTVPADASYITGTSVDVTVSASKTGFTPPTDVTRSLTVDLAAPTVTYTAPSSLQVGAEVDVRPTTSDTDISSYSASGLPSGLSINGTTGAISGTPDTVDADTASVTVTVTDNAGNPVEVSITFPMVEKGDQTLTGFAYSSNSMTFGDTAPTVTAPPSAVGTLSYTATPAEVCTVNETSGALTIVGVGACEVTVTAASTDEYNEATAKYTVTVNAAGTLTLNLDAIATDNTVNIAEKTAGFSISGDTGSEAGVNVSVAIGATTLTTTSADVSGTAEWSVTVPAEASHITGASVDVTVSASKAGFTAPTDVTRSLAIDLAAPSVTYAAPSSLKVGAEVDVRPTTSDTDISSYSASGLPSGLSINATTGAISGAPDTVDANTASVTVTVTDAAGNPAEVSITFPMVNAAGALTLNLDTIATDDTVNIAEKTAGFSISGDTGA